MIFKLVKKILYNGEFLELNLENQLIQRQYKLKYIILVLIKKIFRILYKKCQRLILKPKTRSYFANFEKFIFKDKITSNFEDSFSKARKLHQDSFLEIEDLFNSEQLNKIKNYFSVNRLLTPVYTDHKPFYQNSPPEEASTGYIKTEEILACPEILVGANNDKLLNIIQNYFNAKFKLDWIWAWWSYPTKDLAGPQYFHRDYESMNFLKVFIYLTDVGEKNGPHEIIQGSHNMNLFYKRQRFKDEDIFSKIDIRKKKSFVGKAGTTFIANTYGIHRGLQPEEKERLVLVYLFSIIPSNRSPKLPYLNSKDLNFVIKNKYVYDQFVNFNN